MSKEKTTTIEEKKKKYKQIIMTISMIAVSIFVISVASYAWYMISNTPKIVSAEFVADTIGNLQISNVKPDGTPELYKNEINLFDGLAPEEINKIYLSPITTTDGVVFHKPIYVQGEIDHMELMDESVEAVKTELHTKYIYEKQFFLRAGNVSGTVDQDKAKYYDIHLLGQTTDEQSGASGFDINYGTYMRDRDLDNNDEPLNGSASYSMRISFVFENTKTGDKVIYEPNNDKNNTASQDNRSIYTNKTGETFGEYTTIKQKADKSFIDGDASMSDAICTIKEGVDVKVTMRVWVEGMDEDCTNEVAADKIFGQIQFISQENLTYITN